MENSIIKNEKQLLQELDGMEESIKLLDVLDKKYKDLKTQIKSKMVETANQNGLDQIKWITPNGTMVTCSIGHSAEIQKVPKKFFDEEYLKKQYPNIYEECCRDVQESVIVKNATNDTLRITFAKDKEE